MLETLKASLFLFSLSLSFPLYRKKPHPFLPLVAPRNSPLRYQILSPTNERERERGIPVFESFSHYRTSFVRNVVLTTVNQTSDKERGRVRERERKRGFHTRSFECPHLGYICIYIYIQTDVL